MSSKRCDREVQKNKTPQETFIWGAVHCYGYFIIIQKKEKGNQHGGDSGLAPRLRGGPRGLMVTGWGFAKAVDSNAKAR